MELEIKFKIGSLDDARAAAKICQGVGLALRFPGPDPASTVAPVEDTAPVQSAPVPSAPPAPTQVVKKRAKKAEQTDQPEQSARLMLLDKVREKGVLWAREAILTRYDVVKLSDLTEAQVAQVLADVA